MKFDWLGCQLQEPNIQREGKELVWTNLNSSFQVDNPIIGLQIDPINFPTRQISNINGPKLCVQRN